MVCFPLPYLAARLRASFLPPSKKTIAAASLESIMDGSHFGGVNFGVDKGKRAAFNGGTDCATDDKVTDRALPATSSEKCTEQPATDKHKDQQADRCAEDRPTGPPNERRTNGSSCCPRRCNEQWQVEQLAKARSAVPRGPYQQNHRTQFLKACVSRDSDLMRVSSGSDTLLACREFFCALTGFSKDWFALENFVGRNKGIACGSTKQ